MLFFLFQSYRAENGTRTRDPNLGKVVLYQLSYFRILNHFKVSENFVVITFSLKRGAKVRSFLQTTKYFGDFFQKTVHFFSFLVKTPTLSHRKLHISPLTPHSATGTPPGAQTMSEITFFITYLNFLFS